MQAEDKGFEGRAMTYREFNFRFLWAAQCFIPKVALALIRECREDIKFFGLEYAQLKWAKFVDKEPI